MTADENVIQREMFIAASPETVFRFLIEPGLMAKWIGLSHRLDPRPGGVFHVEVSEGNVARGVYTEVIPPRRVVFTWGWEPTSVQGALVALPPGSSIVEIDLETKDGGTLLRLRHRHLPTTISGMHGERWSHYLTRLATAAQTASVSMSGRRHESEGQQCAR